MSELTYDEKKVIADNYIQKITDGNCWWDELPDINSLHDAQTEEDIHSACDDRLSDFHDFVDFMDE